MTPEIRSTKPQAKMATTARMSAIACAVALGIGLTPATANAATIGWVEFLVEPAAGQSVSSAGWGRAWNLCRQIRPATKSVRLVKDSPTGNLHWTRWNCYNTTNAT